MLDPLPPRALNSVRLIDCTAPALVDLVRSRVPAGFPSPAQDLAVHRIDLNEILIQHPVATYIVIVKGDSMRDAGIEDGDRLIVDRALTPVHGNIVVAVVDGELTVKRLYRKNGVVKLVAANSTYPEIRMNENTDLQVWGVVTYCIKKLK